jgi:hypothetical protein
MKMDELLISLTASSLSKYKRENTEEGKKDVLRAEAQIKKL